MIKPDTPACMTQFKNGIASILKENSGIPDMEDSDFEHLVYLAAKKVRQFKNAPSNERDNFDLKVTRRDDGSYRRFFFMFKESTDNSCKLNLYKVKGYNWVYEKRTESISSRDLSACTCSVSQGSYEGTIQSSSSSNVDQETYHIVKHGESLGGIAKMYAVDFENLALWNNLQSPYPLKLGQRLIIKW